jgi:hypothetical protein
MMHYKDIVVSICDSNKKALREYDAQRLENGRRTNVHIPFDTEYQILVKNNQYKNIRLDIDIDGSNVTNDGIIIRPWYTVYLERFLNSQNKFKFVPVSNEGVADPTSKENGIITVNAYFEKQVEPKPLPTPRFPILRGMNGPMMGSAADWHSPPSYTYGASGSLVKYCCSPGINVRETDYSLTSITTTASIGQAGATIEGGRSNQTFSEAYWNGDDPLVQPVTFKFKLLGMNSDTSKEWQEYQRLKQKFNAA